MEFEEKPNYKFAFTSGFHGSNSVEMKIELGRPLKVD